MRLLTNDIVCQRMLRHGSCWQLRQRKLSSWCDHKTWGRRRRHFLALHLLPKSRGRI